MPDNSDESEKPSEKTDFEMLKKSESLFDQVKESMPEEEWLVLYMKGRVSWTGTNYASAQKIKNLGTISTYFLLDRIFQDLEYRF